MKIAAVLVRTEYSTNIGAAARALANLGGDRLILIDPRCQLNAKARQMAAGAQDQLRAVTVYQDWESFYRHEDEGVRIALSRRGGRKRKVVALEEQLAALAATGPEARNIHLIFGPEADGLDSEDLAYVNFVCHLPVYGEFGSFNLGQAVLLAMYMVRSRFPPATRHPQVSGGMEPPAQPFYFPDHLIKQWLEAMGFDVRARRSSAYLTLRRLFLQNLPTRHEIQVLEAVLQQNIRKLKAKSLTTAEELADDLGDVPVKELV